MNPPVYTLVNGGKVRCPPDWTWHHVANGVSHTVLWNVAGGSGELVVDGVAHSLTRGDCFELLPEHDVRGRHDPEDALLVYWIHYKVEEGQRATTLHQWLPEMSFYQELLERILLQRRGRSVWLDAALAERDRQGEGQDSPKGYEREQARRVAEVCAEITAHPEREWLVEALARRLACSRQHLRRLFMKYAGAAPARYIVGRRVEAAKGLLAGSSMTVTQIADALGYSDVFFFSRQFKAVAGVSPGQYRR